MSADPGFTLVDVQTVLRHAHLSTTQFYLQPRIEDLVEKVAQLQQRRAEASTVRPDGGRGPRRRCGGRASGLGPMTATTTAAPVPVTADDRFDVLKRFRPLMAYDQGLPAPPRPAKGPGATLVSGSVEDVIEVVAAQCGVLMVTHVRNRTVRWTSRLLGWLEQFPGEDWEARWLASGADTAPPDLGGCASSSRSGEPP